MISIILFIIIMLINYHITHRSIIIPNSAQKIGYRGGKYTATEPALHACVAIAIYIKYKVITTIKIRSTEIQIIYTCMSVATYNYSLNLR